MNSPDTVVQDKRWVKGMRDSFFDSLFEEAKKDKDIILVTSDTGAICHDDFKKTLPKQYINVGIAEQNMIGIASGLAMNNKKVFCYAIVPFATMRCLEQIKVNICCMNLPVTIVGIGAGFDYSTLGPTHHGIDDIALMKTLPGMKVFSPSDSLTAYNLAPYLNLNSGPAYLRLDRTGSPNLYTSFAPDIEKGYTEFNYKGDALIISTGRMSFTANEIIKDLQKSGTTIDLIDLIKISPLPKNGFFELLSKHEKIITLEEHLLSGGIGSSILEFLSDNGLSKNIYRIGIPDCFCRVYGKREYLLETLKLDFKSIKNKIIALTD